MTGREKEIVTHALDAFECGDQRLGVDLLVDLLEGPAKRRTFKCGLCTMAFEWPGLLQHHRGLAHGEWQ